MQSDDVVVVTLRSAFLASSPRLLAMLARSASGPVNDDDADDPLTMPVIALSRSSSLATALPAEPQNNRHRPGREIPRPIPKSFPPI